MINRYSILVLVLAAGSAWAQVDNSAGAVAQDTAEDRMYTPPAAGGESMSMTFAAETPRSNYLRIGANFSAAYDDNLSTGSQSLSDISYSIWPSIALDQTRSRLHWDLSYSPGFTFYQKENSRNQVDHNLSLDFDYRISPHVTFTAREGFAKTSSFFSQFSQVPGADSGGAPARGNEVVAPISDRISNTTFAGVTYQFARNGMIGASGSLSILKYLDRSEDQGLADSSSRGGQAFYDYRISGHHSIGITYQYQYLTADPNDTNTNVHSAMVFYTLSLPPSFVVSLYAGPEYSNTTFGGFTAAKSWSPGGGGTFGWQGQRTTFSLGASRRVSEGGGLSTAVRSDSATAAFRAQITKHLTGGIEGAYSSNSAISSFPGASSGGHTVYGTVSLERPIAGRLNMQLAYTRLHQTYDDIASITPDHNRIWVVLGYHFERPLGR